MNFFLSEDHVCYVCRHEGPCNSASAPQESKATGWKSLLGVSNSLPEHHNTSVIISHENLRDRKLNSLKTI